LPTAINSPWRLSDKHVRNLCCILLYPDKC
jgi:hypothetical protein